MRANARLLGLAATIVLLIATPAMAAAEVRARLSAPTTAIDQPVQLVLEAEGSGELRPDLSVLDADFQILDRRFQSSVSVVNGRRRERHALTLILLPRRNGELEIPAIPFGGERSPPLRLTVTGEPSAAAAQTATASPFAPAYDFSGADLGGLPSVFPGLSPFAQPGPDPMLGQIAPAPALIEAEIAPQEVRVREQALLTVRVLADWPFPGAGLLDPQPRGGRVLPLGEDRYPVTRDGRSYQVYERRYAVFADQPGALEIGPIQYAGAAAGSSGQSPVSSPVVSLRVRPPPAGIARTAWLPARRLSLSETAPEVVRIRPGQALERVITLTAEGVPASDLPPIPLNTPFQLEQQTGTPQLWDRRERDGIVGNRVERVRLTAREPGVYRLPEVRLAWWSTIEGRAQTAVLPARELEVLALAATEERTVLGEGAAASGPRPAVAGSEATSAEGSGTAETGTAGINPWFWVSVLLAATLLLVLRARRREPPAPSVAERRERPLSPAAPPNPAPPTDPVEAAIEEVRHAYSTASATAAREALLTWARLVMADAPPSNLARLAQRCPEPLRSEILLLEEAFFSPRPVPWAEQPVWTRLRDLSPLPPEEPASHRRAKPLRRRKAEPEVT